MKTINSLLFLLTTIVICAKSKTSTYECMNQGDKCGDYSICPRGMCVEVNLTSTTTSSSSGSSGEMVRICKPLFKENEHCYASYDCEFGVSCYYDDEEKTHGVCKGHRYATLGEHCEIDFNCLSNLKCIDSVCTRNGSCDYSGECQYGHFCSNSSCVPVSDIGEYCDSNDGCKLGHFCGNNTCIEKYSLQKGDTCFDGMDQQCDISNNLTCVKFGEEFRCETENIYIYQKLIIVNKMVVNLKVRIVMVA